MSDAPPAPDLPETVDALVALGASAGLSESDIRSEAAALAAAAAHGAAGADADWADAFGARAGGFDAAARAGNNFSRKATPVLAKLVAERSAQAEAYAHALAEVASAACSLGDPSISSVSTASIIAAAQLDTILPAPTLSANRVRPGTPPRPVPSAPWTPGVPTASGGPVPSAPSGTGSTATAATATEAAKEEAPQPPPKTLEELLDELDELVGLDKVKDEVRQQAEVLRIGKLRTAKDLKDPSMTRHLIFVGNPGTGKTTVARLVAGIYRALGVLEGGQLVECDRSSLVAGYVGQTALKTTEMATKAIGGALFIDEAYSLAGDEYGEEAIDTLVKQMEDHRAELVVIVAGYPLPMDEFIDSNPGLSSRFRLTLTFEDYSDDQLVEIFTKIVDGSDFTPAAGCIDKLRQILTLTPRDTGFGNARFVRTLFESAVVRQAWRLRDQKDPTVDQLRELTADDLGPLPELTPPEGAAKTAGDAAAGAGADAVQAVLDALASAPTETPAPPESSASPESSAPAESSAPPEGNDT